MYSSATLFILNSSKIQILTMKSVNLLFLILFLSFYGFSQKKAPQCDKVDALSVNYIDEVPDDYTGAIKVCYETGELSALLTLDNGLSDGMSKQWFKSGQRKVEESYKKGVLDGKSRSWYKSGNKQAETVYLDGKAEGISQIW